MAQQQTNQEEMAKREVRHTQKKTTHAQKQSEQGDIGLPRLAYKIDSV